MTEDAAVLDYLRQNGGKPFYALCAAFDGIPFRKLDAAIQRLRRAGSVRTVRDRRKYGDGASRWEAA